MSYKQKCEIFSKNQCYKQYSILQITTGWYNGSKRY